MKSAWRGLPGHALVAVLFLLLGLLVGAEATRQAERAWLGATIDAAFARQDGRLQELILAARPPNLEDSSSRFAVSADERAWLGPDDARVEIIEFGDFSCGYCARFHSETLPQLLANYAADLRFVWRDFPILGERSTMAAIAARCAGAQGQFWPYHDLLFEGSPAPVDADGFARLAQELELDLAAFDSCFAEQAPLEEITADFRAAQDLGIRGTPAFFINGRPLLGARSFADFARLIDEELAAVAEPAAT